MATRSRTDQEVGEQLSLQLTCVVCGRPITLTADEAGTELPDRVAFLAEHRACIEATSSSAPPAAD